MSFVLWAFKFKTHYEPEVLIGTPVPIPGGVHISSFTPPPPEPPKQEPKPNRRKTQQPIPDHGQIKIVSDLLKVQQPVAKPTPVKLPMLPMLPPAGSTGSEPTILVDQRPSFPGGYEALTAFMEKNIVYPDDCYWIDLEGVVKVKYVIDEEGNITHVEVLKNELLPSALEEVKRVLKLMPKWAPAMKDGKPVKTYFVQPIHFRLN